MATEGAARFRRASPATCWPLALPPPATIIDVINRCRTVNLSVEIKQMKRYRQPKFDPVYCVFIYKRNTKKKGSGWAGLEGVVSHGSSTRSSAVRSHLAPPSLPTVSSPCCSWREADAILLAELTLSGRSQKSIGSRFAWAVLTGATLATANLQVHHQHTFPKFVLNIYNIYSGTKTVANEPASTEPRRR